MSQLLEVVMVVLFGLSWPVSISKSMKSRTAKGKSILFLLCVLAGYAAGIAGKFAGGNVTYVVMFYIINFFMVLADIFIYIRNARLDKSAAA